MTQASVRLVDTHWALKNPLKLYAVGVCENIRDWLKLGLGGGREIRTHEGRKPLPVFKTGAFNRSASPP